MGSCHTRSGAVIWIEFIEPRAFQFVVEFVSIDLALVFLEVFDDDERPVDAEVDIGFLAGQVKQGALLARRERMKKAVAFGVLIEHLAKFLGHRQTVFTGVKLKPDTHGIADTNA